MKYLHVLAATLALMVFGPPLAAQDVGIPYEKKPREDLTVGGQPTLRQLEKFKNLGYTTVINLRRKGEFDDFDEAAEIERLGLDYVHIPVRNIEAITPGDARALHQAITNASGPVLLHCTVGWRAGGLLAIESYLLHDASVDEALDLAAKAHMSHVTGDVESWIRSSRK